MRLIITILITLLLSGGSRLYGTSVELKNCENLFSKSIPSPAPAISITKIDVQCYGDHTGSIDLTVTGAVGFLHFKWNDGPTTEDRTGLAAGNYGVDVMDDNGTYHQ